MTVTATVISQSFKDSSPNGSQSFEKRWRAVSDIALDVENATALAQIRAATCKEPLSPLLSTGFSTASWIGTLRLRDLSIVPVPGSKGYVFDVIGQYRSEYTWADISGGGGTDKLILPVTVDMQAGERAVQAWRSDSFSLPPSYIYGKSNDIGGTRIDDAGKPTLVQVPTMKVKVTMVQDCGNSAIGTLVGVYDKINLVQGKWNSVAFLHWNQYEVYCTNATVTNIYDEYYRISYEFIWDFWKGCTQIPEYDTSGRPLIDGANKTAKYVFWNGLKRSTVDPNVIFNTNTDATLAKQMAFEGSYLTYP